MDPNATLAAFLDACREYNASQGGQSGAGKLAQRDALRTLEDLVAWIRKGGFLPEDPRPKGDAYFNALAAD